MKIETRGADGEPVCPVCGGEVPEAGQFDSPSCYKHFLVVVQDQPGIIEMEYLDLEDQPWHTQGTELPKE